MLSLVKFVERNSLPFASPPRPPQPFCLKRCWQVQLLFLLRKTGSAHAEKVSAARGSGLPLGNALDERPGRRRCGGKRSRCWRHLPGSGAGSCSGPPPAGPATRRAAGPGGATLSHHWAARGWERPAGGWPSRPQPASGSSGQGRDLRAVLRSSVRCSRSTRYNSDALPAHGARGGPAGTRLRVAGVPHGSPPVACRRLHPTRVCTHPRAPHVIIPGFSSKCPSNHSMAAIF